tara:strand:- start:1017 stop:1457 length:441 start_codon:yes stop_codon:yes gene_type:complete
MRVVIQRVSGANVRVGDEIVGEIGPGLVLLVCFEKGDLPVILEKASKKILNLRCFEDPNTRKMGKNVSEIEGGSLLAISQFTLSWRGEKGNRPGFDNSMEPEKANKMFEDFCSILKRTIEVQKGVFGEFMEVSIKNQGPVTFCLDF